MLSCFTRWESLNTGQPGHGLLNIRQFLQQKLHYSKTVLTAKVPLFKGRPYGESSTNQKQLLRRKFHYSKQLLRRKFHYSKQFYCKTSTIQRQFLWQNLHYSKAVLMAKLPLFKGSSNGYSKAVLAVKLPLFKGSSYGKTSTIQRQFIQ